MPAFSERTRTAKISAWVKQIGSIVPLHFVVLLTPSVVLLVSRSGSVVPCGLSTPVIRKHEYLPSRVRPLLSPLLALPTYDRLVEQGDGDDEEGGSGGGIKRADIGDVYQEMAGVLVPRVIKRNAKGEQFR